MTTVINTPSRDVADNSVGWTVAVIILLLAIAGGFYLWLQYETPVATETGDTNISVVLPDESIVPLQADVVSQ